MMPPDKSSHQHLLDSRLECTQKYKDGVLENASCTESNLLTPFSRKGHGAKIATRSALHLLKREIDISSYQDLGDLLESTLLFDLKANGRSEGTKYPTGDQVADTVRKLCITKVLNSEAAELFTTLVFELRSLSFDALRHLWQTASFKCRDDWHPLVDALPACGTEACVSLMKEIIISKEVEDEKVESFLHSLPFISEPTFGMLSALAAM
ncbi:uncharacterized protein LOC122816128 [Protopterus annectens]|uniref:uncharacterized protein LOC122816128 n=1 Tax=Protopterus annectens TaxID=7888 RepID=UPI001CFC184B|nr:uncharacterized protein LOC122816128 [Protopterus annectens]